LRIGESPWLYTAGVNGQKYALTAAEESLLALTSPPGPVIRFRKTMNVV
jgi:hypothetical protein